MPEAGRSADRIPVALTIAGSDSSGGAGIQADLKTFHRFGVYGASVITAVTAQNTTDISAIHPIPPEIVVEQYRQVMKDIKVDAVKTGMLMNVGIIKALARAFEEYPPPNLVVDPVMISSSGTSLLDPTALEAMIELIFPRAVLVTPNLNEASALLKSDPIETIESMKEASVEIQKLGQAAVLVKGGHLPENEDAVDILNEGKETEEFRASRLTMKNVHGTGCTHSAAITAGLAKGTAIRESVQMAMLFIARSILDCAEIGMGARMQFQFDSGTGDKD